MNYQVWANQGQAGFCVKRRPTLRLALAYTEKHKGEASFAIKKPDGTWYQWPPDAK